MAPRAIWKGFLDAGGLNCAVALYAATSTSERISLHMVSRKTGHRLRRQYVDQDSGRPVESDDQVKGFEVAQGEYITLEPEVVAAIVPESTKTIAIDTYLACTDIDTIYLDRPYFLAAADRASADALAALAAGLKEAKAAALGEAVLFRRVRKLLIRPQEDGAALLAATLNFNYEVRSAEDAFSDVPDTKVTGEMLDLATHIIGSKAGKFDPAAFDDRYENALAELVRAKMEGKPLPKRAPRKEEKVVDLLEALRASAKPAGKTPARKASAGEAAKSKRKPAAQARARKAG